MRHIRKFTAFALLLTTITFLSSACYHFILSSNKAHNIEAKEAPSLTPRHRGRTDAVILLTQKRSGSSVLGEIFNQRTDVAYFYEPLLPFTERKCEELLGDRLQVLRKIVSCRFDLEEHYIRGFNASKCTDKHAQCLKKKVCFTGGSKYSRFLSRDAGLCKVGNYNQQQCPEPIDLPALTKYCKQTLLRAMKVIYLCKLEWLVPLLSSHTPNVKVVHLVRDPRATINSRIRGNKSKNRISTVRYAADGICPKMTDNIIFAENILRTGELKDQYMRIRHEDFAMNPVEVTQAVYDFIGINMNPTIEAWLREATSAKNDNDLSVKNYQGTTRNSAAVVSNWRTSLSYEEVQEVQKICSEALDMLGYRRFESEKEMKDIESNPHFTYSSGANN